jgi:hypothetical protein
MLLESQCHKPTGLNILGHELYISNQIFNSRLFFEKTKLLTSAYCDEHTYTSSVVMQLLPRDPYCLRSSYLATAVLQLLNWRSFCDKGLIIHNIL